jgi:hypothetical protein
MDMCDVLARLLADPSPAAVALTNAAFGQATDGFPYVIGGIAVAAAVVALALVVVIAVADCIGRERLLK